MPPSYHSGEDIHEQRNINEASFESDIDYIAHPDLITFGDLKGFKAIDPRLWTFKRSRGLTGTFGNDQEIIGCCYRRYEVQFLLENSHRYGCYYAKYAKYYGNSNWV